eukprot:14582116-Heterocapsa_arctica.AAC.1
MWERINPDYKGAVGAAVVDLGFARRAHMRASPNNDKRVGGANQAAGRTSALPLSLRDKVVILKMAGQSRAIYGAAVDPCTQGQLKSLSGGFATALWPKKYAA